MSADSSVVLPVLKENRLFQGLDDAQLVWVAEAIIPVNLEAGEELPLGEELEYHFLCRDFWISADHKAGQPEKAGSFPAQA